jgi:hypothetical protein
MAVDQELVDEVLAENNFTITGMESDPDKDITRLSVVHNLHPEDSIFIDIVSKDENGEDIMEMQFTGPEVWTDEEATQVLQEVMDTLVKVVEKAIGDEVEEAIPDEPQDPEEGEPIDENN